MLPRGRPLDSSYLGSPLAALIPWLLRDAEQSGQITAEDEGFHI